ncbi:hypothetical protein FHS78_003460 [Parvibaculum indicum]|jgi:hypothetical protein|nr:hypothetical protein [Parvibaculum indicum]
MADFLLAMSHATTLTAIDLINLCRLDFSRKGSIHVHAPSGAGPAGIIVRGLSG